MGVASALKARSPATSISNRLASTSPNLRIIPLRFSFDDVKTIVSTTFPLGFQTPPVLRSQDVDALALDVAA
jgi:hypothetical protein